MELIPTQASEGVDDCAASPCMPTCMTMTECEEEEEPKDPADDIPPEVIEAIEKVHDIAEPQIE